jgi:hypothetical protein
MINYYKLVPGSTFFEIQRVKNVNRQKVEYTDYEGNWWFRYSGSEYCDSVIKLEVLGVLQKSIIGLWDESRLEDAKPSFYVKNTHTNNNLILTYKQLDSNNYFADEETATQYLKSLESGK